MIDLDGAPCCPLCSTAPLRVTEHRQEGEPSIWTAECPSGCYEWTELWDEPTYRSMPGFAPLVAEIERLRAELAPAIHGLGSLSVQLGQATSERDRALEELADARLALAMARGEGWPKGWVYDFGRDGWRSPCGEYVITRENHVSGRMLWRLRRRAPQADGSVAWLAAQTKDHPDAIAALRAYEGLPR